VVGWQFSVFRGNVTRMMCGECVGM
jgi:hypothetical protein